jgi:hypothetical protein
MGTSSSTINVARAVNGLVSDPVSLDSHEVWKEIFVTKVTPQDLAACLSAEVLRKMRVDLPGNLAAIVFKCVEQLHVFNSTPEAQRDPISATNAVLIIARVMPYVYENKIVNPDGTINDLTGEKFRHCRDFATRVLWKNDMCNGTDKQWPITAPLGKMLIQTLIAAAFVPGFTLPSGKALCSDALPNSPLVEYHLLWCAGVLTSPAVSITWNESVQWNRVYLLKAILSCLSEECYQPKAGARPPLRSILVDDRECPHASTFLTSLLNSVVTYTTRGVLPYTSHWVGAREEVVLKSTQILSIVFDVDHVESQPEARPPAATAAPGDASARAEGAPHDEVEPGVATVAHHAAWGIIESCTVKDLDVVIVGLLKMLCNHYDSKNVNLPGSQRQLAFQEEFVILFFKLVTKSKKFLLHLVNHPDACKFLLPLLDFALPAKEDQAVMSNLQLVLYLIMKLTAVREFCLACNTLFYGWLPFQLSCYFTGSHVDLLIVSMHTIIASKNAWLAPLHEPCATIICNLSPFCTKIGMASSAKLMQLLDHYSKPSVLEQTGHAGASILTSTVESIANLIQYQYAGSATLMYNLVYFEKTVRALHQGLSDGTIQFPPELKRRMHVFTLICTLDALIPQIQLRLNRDVNADIYGFIRTTSLVGALPVPHSIVVKQFVNRPQTETWLAAWLWGCIFLHSDPVLLDPRTVELFEIRTA